MNRLEKVCNDIKDKIRRQNDSYDLYGKHSYEYQVARIILNETLDTLERCSYIDSYVFNMNSVEPLKIDEVHLLSGSLMIIVSENNIIY